MLLFLTLFYLLEVNIQSLSFLFLTALSFSSQQHFYLFLGKLTRWFRHPRLRRPNTFYYSRGDEVVTTFYDRLELQQRVGEATAKVQTEV